MTRSIFKITDIANSCNTTHDIVNNSYFYGMNVDSYL